MTRDFAPLPPTDEEIAQISLETLGCFPTGITTLRSGAWSRAVGFESERGPMVIRFSATADDFRADELAARFASSFLPIPQVYGIGALGDRYWCISQRMPGIHLDDLDAQGMVEVLPSLTAMLRSMRDVSAADTYGYGGWDTNGNGRFASFAGQLLEVGVDNPGERGGGWSENLRQHAHAQSIFDAGMSSLRELVTFAPDVRQLIHQDTINFNVTVANGKISGIFDWGCAMWGDALYDLAWFRFWNPWYTQWASVNIPDQLERMVGVQGDHAHERMHCYLLHIGIGHIRYNAFTENWSAMTDVVHATDKVLREIRA